MHIYIYILQESTRISGTYMRLAKELRGLRIIEEIYRDHPIVMN